MRTGVSSAAREAADYASRLSEHLELGATLDDVAHLAAEDGLTLEPKGKGSWLATQAANQSSSRPDLTARLFNRLSSEVIRGPRCVVVATLPV